MLTGKRFQMRTETLALAEIGGKREAITIPAGAVIKVVSGPRQNDQLMDVLWAGRIVKVFAVDVDARGREIS